MTSIYRQIGIGCERLFRVVLRDSLDLSETDVKWSYSVPAPNGGQRTLHLDGRLPLAAIADKSKRQRVHAWMAACAEEIGIKKDIFNSLEGAVFEVRQGYKSKDSKRQNADLANAATAYTKAYLPCVTILSTQIDTDILKRYREARWAVLTGMVGGDDPTQSTYDFMKDVVGYDLAGFFRRHSPTIKSEIEKTLTALLSPPKI